MIKVTIAIGELKEHREIISRLNQASNNKEFTLMVIFPTLSLLEAIQREFLAQPGVVGSGGFRFLLFEGFIQEISLRFGINRRKPSPLIREILITECFRKLTREEKLPYLKRIPFNTSYRRAILDGIDEWTRSGFSPGLFENWADTRARAMDEKDRPLREFALIYKTYKDIIIQKGLGEEDQVLSDLEIRNTKKETCGRVWPFKILLYGFTDLTPLQDNFVKVLENYFDFEILVDPTTVLEFQDFITRHFGSTNEKISLPHNFFSPANALTKLQQCYWAREPEVQAIAQEDQSLQLIQTAGLNKTVAGIAREIAGLLRKNPYYSVDDFLILTPQVQEFMKSAVPVFSEYHLPINRVATSLREFPVINHLLQSLIVCADDWPWPEMEILIRLYYQGKLAQIGDRIILLIGERYGALSGRERWLSLTGSDNFRQYFLETGLNPAPLLNGIAKLMSIPAKALLKDYLNIVRNWFNAMEILSAAANGILNCNDDLTKMRISNLAAFQSLQRAIDELQVLLETTAEFQDEITISDFVNFFKEYLLAGEVIEPLTFFGQVIKILHPREARGLKARFVFIAGLEQGTFPRRFVDDWKLTTQDRYELKKMGIKMETGEQYILQERLAFYWALQTATERLYLVNQAQDENGQPLTASMFLEEILQWFPGLKAESKHYLLAPQLPADFKNCLSVYEENSLFAYKLTNIPQITPEINKSSYKEYLAIPFFRHLAFKIYQWQQSHLGQGVYARSYFKEKPVSLALINQIFNEDFVFSITALEDYQSCPFRFFVKHLLKVKPIYRPQFLPEGLELGNFYHEILQQFGENYRGECLFPDRILEYRQALTNSINNYFREWQEKAANDLVRLVLLIQDNHIRQTLERWLASELQWTEDSRARFKIGFLELAFGMDKGDFDEASLANPYQLEVNGVKIKLWGKIDRVDIDTEGNFIVYDYKSSRGPKVKDLLALRNLQIPVYLQALEQLMFGKDKAVGGCYLGLQEPSRSNSGVWLQSKLATAWKGVLPEKEWQEWHETIRMTLAGIVQAIRSGEFPPAADECLSYCEYKKTCRYQGREVEKDGNTSAE